MWLSGGLSFSDVIPRFVLLVLTKGQEAGKPLEVGTTNGTAAGTRHEEGRPSPASCSLPAPEDTFVIAGHGLLCLHVTIYW